MMKLSALPSSMLFISKCCTRTECPNAIHIRQTACAGLNGIVYKARLYSNEDPCNNNHYKGRKKRSILWIERRKRINIWRAKYCVSLNIKEKCSRAQKKERATWTKLMVDKEQTEWMRYWNVQRRECFNLKTKFHDALVNCMLKLFAHNMQTRSFYRQYFGRTHTMHRVIDFEMSFLKKMHRSTKMQRNIFI